MYKLDLKEAESRLPELLEEAARGEEVVITRGDGASFKLVPVVEPRPTFESTRGLIEMNEGFNEPLEGFEEATVEDAMERIDVLQKVEQGLRQLETGQGIPHSEARKRIKTWLE